VKPAWKGHFLVVAAAAWLALVAACSAAPPPPPAPGGATGPSGPSGPGPVAPGASPGAAAATGTAEVPVPAVPAPLPVLSAAARAPGASVPLTAGSPTSVEPTSSFEVRIGARLRSARLVLLDAQDAMVPSVSDIEVGTETVMTLVPDDVLRPGSTYLVRVEGLSGRLLQSDGGKSFEPAGFPLQTTGTAPPKAPPKKSGKRRRGG
jgi:hypothetical protein